MNLIGQDIVYYKLVYPASASLSYFFFFYHTSLK